MLKGVRKASRGSTSLVRCAIHLPGIAFPHVPTDERVSCPPNQLDETAHQRAHDGHSDGKLLDPIDEIRRERHFVEPMPLLDDKVPVQREWQCRHRCDGLRDEQEYQRAPHLSPHGREWMGVSVGYQYQCRPGSSPAPTRPCSQHTSLSSFNPTRGMRVPAAVQMRANAPT